MKIVLSSLLFLLLIVGCKQEKSREELIAEDNKKLKEAIDCYAVNKYKFTKICLRTQRVEDTTMFEYKRFNRKSYEVFNMIKDIDFEENLSPMDLLTLYKAYSDMSEFVSQTDEDVFPLVMEVLPLFFTDSAIIKEPLLKGEEKLVYQCAEHGILSAVTSFAMGPKVALYEASKTNTSLLKYNEEKALLTYLRSLLFLQHGLYYLSENEFSNNITWLDNNPAGSFSKTKLLVDWNTVPEKDVYIGFHALNYLGRALNRLAMPYEKDNELGLDDLEVFLSDFQKLGIQNEIVWAIETYLYLHRGEQEKAITSLSKMKESQLLSSEEKEAIEQTIKYLKNREDGEVLNAIYDKVFLTKLVTRYIISYAQKVDWEKVLKENDVPHSDKAIALIRKMEYISNQLNKAKNGELLETTKDNLMKEGSKLIDIAKDKF